MAEERSTQAVVIYGDFIELNRLLKKADLAATGGEAKILIGEGLIMVDGQPEHRIRRKIRPGSLVECQGVRLRVCQP
ncbi:MAG: RNA-binding protein [Deltaproteobacteria bacterium]|nr:MAG: RNA-binding protein [Deltaproteobacteria bacterium]